MITEDEYKEIKEHIEKEYAKPETQAEMLESISNSLSKFLSLYLFEIHLRNSDYPIQEREQVFNEWENSVTKAFTDTIYTLGEDELIKTMADLTKEQILTFTKRIKEDALKILKY